MASKSVYIRDYSTEIPGELVDPNTWAFPVVNSVNAHGKRTFWKIYVRVLNQGKFVPILKTYFASKPLSDLQGWINVDSGIEGGKVKISSPTIVSIGKNLGKISATNVFTQALRDALGLYNKQAKKSVVVPTSANIDQYTLYPPMLAQILKDQKTIPIIDDTHPAYVQRKYNGVRTVATLDSTGVILYSRRKNIYPGFEYIKKELFTPLNDFKIIGTNIYLDGEIYKHGEYLQLISGNSRREDQPGDLKYDYMVYDCFIPDQPDLIYTERKRLLDNLFAEYSFEHVKHVETFTVNSTKDITIHYNTFISEKYEGAMVRIDEPYQYSYNERHSKRLLKVKPTYDAELEIVGYTTGTKGKATGALMIICKAENGLEFPVTPAMELPDRIALAKKMFELESNGKTHFDTHWLGKKIIVEYDEYSKDGIPQRARTRLQSRTWD